MHNGDWPLRNVSLYVSHINSLLFHDYNIYGRALKYIHYTCSNTLLFVFVLTARVCHVSLLAKESTKHL